MAPYKSVYYDDDDYYYSLNGDAEWQFRSSPAVGRRVGAAGAMNAAAGGIVTHAPLT